MRRKLARLAVYMSTVVAVLLVLLWIRGEFARDRIAFPLAQRYYVVTSFPHHLFIDSGPGWTGMQPSAQFGLSQYLPRARYFELRLARRPAGAWSLAIPIWLPLLFALALPVWSLGTSIKRRQRMVRGLCPVCGYDLRATPWRCPECGYSDPSGATTAESSIIAPASPAR